MVRGSVGWTAIGKPKRRGQPAFADVNPVFARIVTAIDATVVLLIDHIRVGGMHRHFMDALPELRELCPHEIGAHIFVIGCPGLPAIVGAVAACGGDRNIHPLGICGVQQDRVQGQASGAGIPLAALWMVVQTFIDFPGFPAVFGDE